MAPKTNFSNHLQDSYHHQDQLGWDQLFYSRIAITWAHHIDDTSNGSTNGTIFYSKIIMLLW